MLNALAEKQLSEIPIVVLDSETTGLSPGLGHRVVEVGAVRLEQWQIVSEFSRLIQPDRKMDPGASAVNGISDADLSGQARFCDIADDLLGLLEGALLVAHNASFDAGFLGNEFFICGYGENRETREPILPNPWLCTLQLARRNFTFGRNNLGHIARRLGVRSGRSHRALSDVHTTTKILKRMADQLAKRRLSTVGDLILAQGGSIFMPSVPRIDLPQAMRHALENQSKLEIVYAGTGAGRTRRVITPLYPAKHSGTTYIIAYCHLREDRRTFRLDRMLDIAKTS